MKARETNVLGEHLRRHGVGALFDGQAHGADLDVPLVAWIPDLQHLRLPQYFDADELRWRDALFGGIIRYASRIVVSSEDVLGDLGWFAPEAVARTRVLSFVAQVPDDVYDEESRCAVRKYHLPQRYFFLPNQFWKHKNHPLVLEALSRLRSVAPGIHVACTGTPHDYRHPDHFGRLLAQIAELGLAGAVTLLGSVPHLDVLRLMRHSVAVLQPSLFEGWSTTVEESKSLGKGLILSDLAVHREQEPPRALYFDPTSPAALAERMLEAWEHWAPGPTADLEAEARALLPERTRAFGRRTVAVLDEVLV